MFKKNIDIITFRKTLYQTWQNIGLLIILRVLIYSKEQKKMWKLIVKEYADASNIFKVYVMWSLE